MNRFSSKLTQVKSQGASQAMLYATGITKDDMNKAQVPNVPINGIQFRSALARHSLGSLPGEPSYISFPYVKLSTMELDRK